eukprot:179397-Amorphochlora_amoeboformis.AAC.1
MHAVETDFESLPSEPQDLSFEVIFALTSLQRGQDYIGLGLGLELGLGLWLGLRRVGVRAMFK